MFVNNRRAIAIPASGSGNSSDNSSDNSYDRYNTLPVNGIFVDIHSVEQQQQQRRALIKAIKRSGTIQIEGEAWLSRLLREEDDLQRQIRKRRLCRIASSNNNQIELERPVKEKNKNLQSYFETIAEVW